MKHKIGWMLMGIPWLSDRHFIHGIMKNNWHAKIYHLGSRMCSQ